MICQNKNNTCFTSNTFYLQWKCLVKNNKNKILKKQSCVMRTNELLFILYTIQDLPK